jgi:hypothetical protein
MNRYKPPLFQRRIMSGKLCLAVLGLVLAPLCLAADSQKVKVLESCNTVDLKALRIYEAKVKAVTTQDPAHRKAIEIVMDYAKAGAWSGIGKDFPPGVNLKKYSAIRFWVRSDCGTSFGFGLGGDYKRADGKYPGFGGVGYTASETWSQITIPLENFKRGTIKTWDPVKKEQVILPGGDSMDAQDLANVSRWGLHSYVNNRGTSTIGHLMFDAFELVEK